MIRRILYKTWPLLLAAITFITVEVAVSHPLFIERYYTKALYPLIAASISYLSSTIPFSIWDVFWIVVTLTLIAALIFVLLKKLKITLFLLRLFQLLAILYCFFYLSWGFNYFRPKIEARSGWDKPAPTEANFREIFDTIIAKTNRSYSVIAYSDYKILDTLIEKSYKSNASFFGIHYPNGYRTPKKMILSSFFAKSGVSGYFGPFFNEIHLNSFLLPTEYPFVLAHEKAHQFGISEEAEANLAAFIVCSTSGDRRLQYSGNLQLLTYFLYDARQLSDRHKYVERIDSLVVKDILTQRRHWHSMENKTLDKVQTAANNAYLKSNKIKEGVKNYNRVVSLVISWYLNNERMKE